MNLFDGSTGITDGTSDGVSKEILGSGGPVDVFVTGNFDGATVVLQRFSEVKKDFMPTAAVWIDSDEFQGLVVDSGERYRLLLKDAGANTEITAETG